MGLHLLPALFCDMFIRGNMTSRLILYEPKTRQNKICRWRSEGRGHLCKIYKAPIFSACLVIPFPLASVSANNRWVDM